MNLISIVDISASRNHIKMKSIRSAERVLQGNHILMKAISYVDNAGDDSILSTSGLCFNGNPIMFLFPCVQYKNFWN